MTIKKDKAFQMSLEIISRIVVESGNCEPVKTILDGYDLKALVPFFSSNPLSLNTEHTAFQADHPRLTIEQGQVVLNDADGGDYGYMSQKFTPDEAIALGFALFSIGLTLKGS